MRFKGLDLNLLVALDALLAEKNVSRAARRVFRSQPAMSGALAKLREHFQDDLLVPLGRRLVLTARGESLVLPLQRLMEHIDQTVDVGAQFDPAASHRRFTLCVTEQMVELLMPQVARRVAREAPNVRLEILSAASGAADMLANGEVDLLLVTEPAISRDFYAETLYEDSYAILGWRENARLREPLNLDDFFKMGRVVAQFGRQRSMAYAEVQMQRFPGGQNIELIVPTFTAIPKFLVGTNRIALMYRRLAEAYCRDLDLIVAPLPVELQPLRLMLQNHPARVGDVGIDWLKAVITESVDTISDKFCR